MRYFGKAAAIAVLGFVSLAWPGGLAADELRVATFQSDITPPLGQPMISGDRCDCGTAAAGQGNRAASRRRIVTCSAPWIGASCATGRTTNCRKACGRGRHRARPRGGAMRPPAHRALGGPRRPKVAGPGRRGRTATRSAGVCTRSNGSSWRGRQGVGRAARAIRPDRHRAGQGRARRRHPPAGGRGGQDLGALQLLQGGRPAGLPEGAIDPYLKTITLAEGEKPLVRLHYYATHPQSFYGDIGPAATCRATPAKSSNAKKACSRSTSTAAAAT